jgi:hypothetical protein
MMSTQRSVNYIPTLQTHETIGSGLVPAVRVVDEGVDIPCISHFDISSGNCMGGLDHPSRHLDRLITTDYERQNINLRHELGEDVDQYLRSL